MILRDLSINTEGESVFLSWRNYPPSAVRFKVLFSRSGHPDNVSAIGITTNPFFNDLFNYKYLTPSEPSLYRIEALSPSDEVIDTLVVPAERLSEDLHSTTLNMLQYKADLVFRNSEWSFWAHIMRKKTSGQTCNECYSSDLKASADPKCPVCYGTGYVGGYYTPIPTRFIVVNEQDENPTINARIPRSSTYITATFPSFPRIINTDYIYIQHEGIFEIDEAQTRKLQNKSNPTTLVTMRRVDKKNHIYKYPVGNGVSSVESISRDGDRIIIDGNNLIPIYGDTKLSIWSSDGGNYAVYHYTDIKEISDKKIVFSNENKKNVPTTFSYLFWSNYKRFTGINS